MANISMVNICKSYKNGFNAVQNFNLDIKDHELIILVGPSGCGKSTMLRMIAGLEDISSGELWIDDCLMNMVEPGERGLSMVFQNYALYPYMNVYENMAFSLRVRKLPKDEIDKRVREAAELLEITHLLDRKPAQLSGGQKQRVAIGSVIVRRPGIYLLDEPLSNLDARLRGQMRVEIARLHRELGATMIYVTHDQVEAMTLGTRIVVMKDGQIQQVAAPAELYQNPVNRFVAGFIGSPSMNFLEAVVERRNERFWLVGRGWGLPLSGVAARRLEDRGYVGKQVVLGIRPEDIHETGDAETALDFSVQVRELLGSEVVLYGNAGSGPGAQEGTEELLSARLSPDCGAKRGDKLRLFVDMSRIHLFDVDTEENILYI